jgi:acetyltransferase-like isoleucine patch superfamily enzyme
LEIGDDVVFGSRSTLITSSTESAKKIVFESGTMVADRCVILPGVHVRRGAVLGSGTLAHEDFDAPIGSVWGFILF